MRCSSVKKILSDFVDGGLNRKKSTLIKKHLKECSDCAKLEEDFKKIKDSAGKLEKAIPSIETWSKIEANLKLGRQQSLVPDKEKQSWLSIPGFRFAAAAAGITLLIIGALILGPQYFRNSTETAVFYSSQEYTLGKLKEAERYYQQAIVALGEAVDDRENPLDPKIAEVFKTNMKIINSSISACKKAVLSNPENFDSYKYLLAVYEEKADLLHRIINLNGNIPLKRKSETTI